jgi:predicted nucleotidyltransferase
LQILDQLSKIPEVEQVILFGSYAQGRRDLFTDLDLLVVMHSDEDFITRTANLYQKINLQVDVDLLVYTPGELDCKKKSGFLQHVLRTGRVVYEK